MQKKKTLYIIYVKVRFKNNVLLCISYFVYNQLFS